MGVSERKRRKKIRDKVIARDGLVCCYCNTSLTYETVTMDHIVPYSKYGTFNTTNLTVSCANCNNNRGNVHFFEFCEKFSFEENKMNKYRNLYFNNLKIKILNIAKEYCLNEIEKLPNDIINEACIILNINNMDFSSYEKSLDDFYFDKLVNRKIIKFNFEKLIRIIEREGFGYIDVEENIMLQPIRDYIVISKDEVSDKTEGGIIYRPATAEEKIITGSVLEVGSGRVSMDGTVVPLEVKKGDKIFFNKNLATELKDGQKTVFLLREDQVLAIVK